MSRSQTVIVTVPEDCDLRLTAQFWTGLTGDIQRCKVDKTKVQPAHHDFCNGGCQHLDKHVKAAIAQQDSFEKVYPREGCAHVFHWSCLLMQYSASRGDEWDYYPHPSATLDHMYGHFLVSPEFAHVTSVPADFCPVCRLLKSKRKDAIAYNEFDPTCVPKAWLEYLYVPAFAGLSYPRFREEDVKLLTDPEGLGKNMLPGQMLPTCGYRHRKVLYLNPLTRRIEPMPLDDYCCGKLSQAVWTWLYPGMSKDDAEVEYYKTLTPTRCSVSFEEDEKEKAKENKMTSRRKKNVKK